MGMSKTSSLTEQFITWLLLLIRWYVMIQFILPLSFIYDLLMVVRNEFVYTVGTAPRAHTRKVAAIQRQVREWAKG
ncbi:hypothetical protein GCK32_022114, partial [Trichostrongylus colubriformis]